MQFYHLLLLAIAPVVLAEAIATSISFRIPATHLLPNPFSIPPSTQATLSTLHKSRRAPLSTTNTFVFHNVTAGSYLVDIHCPTSGFQPLRLDVISPVEDGSDAGAVTVKIWETFRGNDWDNKGEFVPLQPEGVYDLRPLGAKGYFVERTKFSVLSILKNPMILLGLVSMGIFLGMPYLVDNMDPEMRAEWEERQNANPMNGLMGSASGQAGANPMGFDMAAFLAGSSKKEVADASPVPSKADKKKR